jgi:hypothetical protein
MQPTSKAKVDLDHLFRQACVGQHRDDLGQVAQRSFRNIVRREQLSRGRQRLAWRA